MSVRFLLILVIGYVQQVKLVNYSLYAMRF